MLQTLCECFSSSPLGNPNPVYKYKGSLLSWQATAGPHPARYTQGQLSALQESLVIRQVS